MLARRNSARRFASHGGERNRSLRSACIEHVGLLVHSPTYFFYNILQLVGDRRWLVRLTWWKVIPFNRRHYYVMQSSRENPINCQETVIILLGSIHRSFTTEKLIAIFLLQERQVFLNCLPFPWGWDTIRGTLLRGPQSFVSQHSPPQLCVWLSLSVVQGPELWEWCLPYSFAFKVLDVLSFCWYMQVRFL